ncbi:MAG: hypothetical protein LBS95_01290 [Mycoplasmataceae bacterium]|nr:hypothetical protein [Mycoplasmataceae bacterium]
MKIVQGKFDTVQDNKNLNGKNFSAQINTIKGNSTIRNNKRKSNGGIKKPSKLDFIINQLSKIDKRLNKVEGILERNNLK